MFALQENLSNEQIEKYSEYFSENFLKQFSLMQEVMEKDEIQVDVILPLLIHFPRKVMTLVPKHTHD